MVQLRPRHRFWIGLRAGLWPLQNLHLVVFEPFLWSFCHVLGVLLFQVVALLQTKAGFGDTFLPSCSLYLSKPSRTCCSEASPLPDADSTVLHLEMVCVSGPKSSISFSSEQLLQLWCLSAVLPESLSW